jgi:hypothetical protein
VWSESSFDETIEIPTRHDHRRLSFASKLRSYIRWRSILVGQSLIVFRAHWGSTAVVFNRWFLCWHWLPLFFSWEMGRLSVNLWNIWWVAVVIQGHEQRICLL